MKNIYLIISVVFLLIVAFIPTNAFAEGRLYAVYIAEQSGSYKKTASMNANGGSFSRSDIISLVADPGVRSNNIKVVWKRNGQVFKTHRTGNMSNLMAFSPPPGNYTVTIFVNGNSTFNGSVTLR